MEVCDSCKKELTKGMQAVKLNDTHLFCGNCFFNPQKKEFWSKKKYYIHEFSAVQTWFGNRGISVKRSDIHEWCCDGENLYFMPSLEAPSEIQPGNSRSVIACKLDSVCYECSWEMDYNESPFANKI